MATILMLGMTTSGMAADKKKSAVNATKIRHIVCFQYKANTEAKAIAEINRAFRALKGKIPGITAFEMGENNSPEGLNKGFTHCYIVTFVSTDARDAYLPHPEHNKFVDLLKPHLEDVFVIDFAL